MVVVGGLELHFDDVTDEGVSPAAELLGNVEGTDGGHEDHRDPGDDAGFGQGDHDVLEDLESVGAKVSPRLDELVVEFGHGRVQRQDHEGHIVVDHAEEVIVSSRNTYVYSLDKIQKYSSVGDNTEVNE